MADQDRRVRRFDQIVGNSPALTAVLELAKCVATADSTVLIQGETGTGKELIAHAIHNASRRSGQALIKLNCAAIPFDLLESELFGHERGAFTRYTGGVTGYLEVLTNASNAFSAELALVEARQNELLALVQLYVAPGGGWQQ